MKHHFFLKNRLTLITLASLALLAGCDNSDDYSENHSSNQQSSYLEKYRPQLQFTAAKNWQNDPNGMVYFDGEYHLFYQYNPNGNSWGDLSWGHAVSRDLVYWEELPVALPVEKDADGNVTQMYFSGSAVVDFNNSSGFGKADRPAMVAMYTSYYPTDMTLDNGKTIAAGTQAQSIAYSLDKGRTWTQYEDNPVIPLPPAGYESQFKEFRDPKIFWYAPENKWIMVAVIATQHKAVFYSSTDLRNWNFMSEFGPENAVGGVWECPDLFELPVDGDSNNKKWVMVININPGGPAGGSGNQYFIGHFDGERFTPDDDSVFNGEAPVGSLIADFEESESESGWTATKDLQGAYLSKGDRAGQSGVSQYLGEQLVNTFINGDASVGSVTSPAFKITDRYINLLVGGGNHPRNPDAVEDSVPPSGDLLFAGADFEGEDGATYDDIGWTSNGDFVGQVVASGTIATQQQVSGFMGGKLVNSYFGELVGKGGDAVTGTLTSANFTINKPYINFLVGGGNHPYGAEGAAAVVLLVDGKVVRSATGSDSESLNWTHWDVQEYQGKSARIMIVDENTGGYGHILADQFMAGDEPAQPVSTETTVNLLVDGKVVYSETGDNSETLGWRSWNVAALKGEMAQIRIVDNSTAGFGHVLVDHIIQSDRPKQIANWGDFGSDFYAAVTWNDAPDGKRYWLGWMSNWNYAGSIPTTPWRGGQTLVRELSLQTIDNKIRLVQTPVDALKSLRDNALFTLSEEKVVAPGDTLLADGQVQGQVYEIEAELQPGSASEAGFKVRTGSHGEETLVGYDAAAGEVFIDRTKSGANAFNSGFAARHSAPLPLSDDASVALRIIVDTSSVTVFSGKGEVVLTDQIFPEPASQGIEIYSKGGDINVKSLTIWPLKSIWADK